MKLKSFLYGAVPLPDLRGFEVLRAPDSFLLARGRSGARYSVEKVRGGHRLWPMADAGPCIFIPRD